MDGQLVAVHSVFDNKLLVQLAGKQFQNVNGWWLGGNLTQNGWQWVDGSKFDYNNWESGEPLYGNSLIQLPVVGQWKSVNGNNTYPFICEIPQINTAIPPTKCDDQWLYDADTKKCFFVVFFNRIYRAFILVCNINVFSRSRIPYNEF
uniref:C-type lectin domain-containing protein n=1 Tax=Acrobeloides nanus TaxID=290746 RepID=A0A914D937_9BILA